MRYYLDTEFIEYPTSIHLISLGLVSEVGRELYLEFQFPQEQASEWVKANVIAHLQWKSRDLLRLDQGATRVLEFLEHDHKPEFWGYYADYDWVAFCWMFGTMMDLPDTFPKYCRDLKQRLDSWGNPRIPFKPDQEHNALSDAKWNRRVHQWLLDDKEVLT